MIKKLKTISIALAICSFVSCQSKGEEKTEAPQEKYCLSKELKQSTEIKEVSLQPVQEQISFSGKIEYNENDMVAFKSLLEGFVESVSFDLGDFVKKGQVLATVKSYDIQALVQEKKVQENQIAFLEKKKKSQEALLQDGMISAPELLETEHALASAQIEYNKIQETLQLYKAIGGGLFQIVAPKNGYIIQKNISKGQTLSQDSDLLFSISNLKEVWVMVNIYASNLRYIKEGDPVKVKTVAYPDRVYAGKIQKIYNVFDENEHVLKARVVLENQDLNLMPGLSADIIINKQNASGSAFAVPNEAKIFNNNKEYVVVYKDDCSLEIRKITTMAQNEEFTFVYEKFAPNEKVIARNALIIFEELNK